MNKAFQTPNSNSCIRSTTSMSYRLKPNGASFRENVFFTQVSDSSPACSQPSTYNGGNQGLCLQYVFHCFAIDDVVSLVDDIPSQIDLSLRGFVIYASKRFALLHVSHLSHIRSICKEHKAARTRAVPHIADASKDYSASSQKRAREKETRPTYFSL